MKQSKKLSENEIDFEAASRRGLKERLKYSFIRTHKPILDDGPGFRSFTKLSDYKKWAAKLPKFLGYGKKI